MGPIKDFHLFADREEPDHIISFCDDGVKKISPTRRRCAPGFTPTRDLDIHDLAKLLLTPGEFRRTATKPAAAASGQDRLCALAFG
jgi:hypothetical protein